MPEEVDETARGKELALLVVPAVPPVIWKGKLYWKMEVSDSRVMTMPYVARTAFEGTVQLYEPAEPSTDAVERGKE